MLNWRYEAERDEDLKHRGGRISVVGRSENIKCRIINSHYEREEASSVKKISIENKKKIS